MENSDFPSKLINAIKNKEINWLDYFEDSEDLIEVLNLENEPVSYSEAMASEEKTQWKIAIEEELNSLMKNNTWSLVKRHLIKSKNILTYL